MHDVDSVPMCSFVTGSAGSLWRLEKLREFEVGFSAICPEHQAEFEELLERIRSYTADLEILWERQQVIVIRKKG
jgi:hypothetical protein